MDIRFSRIAATAMMLFALAVPLSAATYLVPSDAEMIQRSDDIVVATAVTSTVERTARGGIVTRYVLRVEEVLKGQRSPGGYLTVTQLGGQLADRTLVVSGSPVYEPGVRYLVFTDADHAGEPITFGADLGQFRFEPDVAGRTLAVRAEIHGYDRNLQPFRDGLRDARGFMEYIRGIVAQRVDPAPGYFVPPSRRMQTNGEVGALAFSRGSYTMDGNPRWQGPAAALVTSGAQSGHGDGGVGSVTNAIAAWNGSDSDINYSYAGQDDTAVGGFQAHDSKDAVLFNDPNNEVEAGVAGRGGFWSTGQTHVIDGETFRNIDGGVDVIINDTGLSPACLRDVMTHELGHTLGFRHANQPKAGTTCGTTADCNPSAIMNSFVDCGAGGQILAWEVAATATVYGAGPICTAPAITQNPASTAINAGQSANLTVTATGTAPLTYQWFIGTPTDTSQPTGTNSATLNVSPTTTTTYWVRVTGSCGSPVNSTAATVTVNPGTCTPPAIASHPTDRTITAGQATTLTVGATGTTPLIYQWFVGTPTNTATPIGTNSPNLTVSPTANTSYWVRVTGQCGSPANSNAATVTVSAPTCPLIDVGAPTATLQGTNYLLNVNAVSGGRALTFQWFRGNTPGSGGTPVGTTQQLSVPVPTAATAYWVRVTNDCGNSANSTTVTVTPASCPGGPPSITTQPQDLTIPSGGTATLTVAFTSSSATTVRWYRGTAPNKTNEVATGASFNTGALTQTTTYWASLTNSCGETQSRTVVVTVQSGPGCTQPSIVGTSGAQTKFRSETVTLTVDAAGTGPLHYQWYEGPAGSITFPVGTDSPTFTSAPLRADTQFWVKVTNDCGEASSSAIPVEVKIPRRRSVRH